MNYPNYSASTEIFNSYPYADLEYVDLPTNNLSANALISPALTDEELVDRDINLTKHMYPKITLAIQSAIDDECDKLEFTGSCIFDDVLDYTHLGIIITNIYDKVNSLTTNELSKPTYPPCSSHSSDCNYKNHHPDYNYDGTPDLIRNLIEIMFYHEIIYRRNRYRKHCKNSI